MKKVDVCFYSEWIEVEINGEIKGFDLTGTNDSNIKIFYTGENYTEPYYFNETTRKINKA